MPKKKKTNYSTFSSSSDEDFLGFESSEKDVKCIASCMTKSNSGKLQCFKCSEEFHYECLEMSASSYKCIIKAASFGSRWHCSTCLNSTTPKSVYEPPVANNSQICANSLKELSKQLDQVKHELKKEIRSQKESYAQVTKKSLDIETKRDDEISSINNNLKIVSSNIATNIETKAESEAKNRKSHNVCIFNIPESAADDPTSKAKDDLKIFLDLVTDKVPLNKEDIKAFYRIDTTSTKSKPIILKLSDPNTRNELLKLRNLKITHSGQVTNDFIQPDRAKKEQQIHKKLVAELREKRNTANKNGSGEKFIIKNDKVIKLQPFRINPQFLWD